MYARLETLPSDSACRTRMILLGSIRKSRGVAPLHGRSVCFTAELTRELMMHQLQEDLRAAGATAGYRGIEAEAPVHVGCSGGIPSLQLLCCSTGVSETSEACPAMFSL